MLFYRPSPPRPVRQVKPLSPPMQPVAQLPAQTAAMRSLNLNEPSTPPAQATARTQPPAGAPTVTREPVTEPLSRPAITKDKGKTGKT